LTPGGGDTGVTGGGDKSGIKVVTPVSPNTSGIRQLYTAEPELIAQEEVADITQKHAEEILVIWNLLPDFPKIRFLSDGRRKTLRERLKNRTWVLNYKEALSKLSFSRFCKGENERKWKATIDWFLRPDTVSKLLEGQYDNRDGKVNGTAVLTASDHRYDEFIAAHPIEKLRVEYPTYNRIPNGDHYLRSEYWRWLKSGKYES
jgi:hypothetical protein